MWVVFIKTKRTEWIHTHTVARTKMEAWEKYKAIWSPENKKFLERDRRNKKVRLGRVKVSEAPRTTE